MAKLQFDRKRFFDLYRSEFGKLSPLQVSGLSQLLDFIEADSHIEKIPYASYELATVKRETDSTYHPIHEYGGKAYFVKRYGGQTKKGKELGNDTPEEGYYYAGKGYPQTTGEANYEKAEVALRREYPEIVADFEARTGKHFDLTVGDQPDDEQDPANMMDPAIAYATMSYGMRKGMFTGHKMSDYLDELPPQYKAARRIINGNDHWIEIAEDAKKFERILTDSQTHSATAPATSKPTESLDKGINNTAGLSEGQSSITDGTSIAQVEITPEGAIKASTSEGPPPPKERIAVVKTKPQKWFSRVTTKITAIITGSALFQWIWSQSEKLTSLPIPDAVWIIVSSSIAAGSLLWIIYEIVDTWRDNKYQENIDKLLIQENSTPDNNAQLIPADEVELYRLRGYKIITRGEPGIPLRALTTEEKAEA